MSARLIGQMFGATAAVLQAPCKSCKYRDHVHEELPFPVNSGCRDSARFVRAACPCADIPTPSAKTQGTPEGIRLTPIGEKSGNQKLGAPLYFMHLSKTISHTQGHCCSDTDPPHVAAAFIPYWTPPPKHDERSSLRATCPQYFGRSAVANRLPAPLHFAELA